MLLHCYYIYSSFLKYQSYVDRLQYWKLLISVILTSFSGRQVVLQHVPAHSIIPVSWGISEQLFPLPCSAGLISVVPAVSVWLVRFSPPALFTCIVWQYISKQVYSQFLFLSFTFNEEICLLQTEAKMSGSLWPFTHSSIGVMELCLRLPEQLLW